MLNALPRLPRQVVNHPVSVAVQEAALNVFAANLNVLQVTRNEAVKVYGAVRRRADDLAVRRVADLKLGLEAANDRVNAAWEGVARLADRRVMPVLDRVGLATPAQAGLDLVGKGLHLVSARVAAVTATPRPAPARKPAVRKTVKVSAKPAAKAAAKPARRTRRAA